MASRPLQTLIRLAVAGLSSAALAPLAMAQNEEAECVEMQGNVPGLYVTVDENQVYIIKDDKVVELNPGEAAFASETDLACLKAPPKVLSWPCDTAEALAREMAPGYSVAELPSVDSVQEVVRRYLEENRAISQQVKLLNGDYHGTFPAYELEALDTTAYWYLPGTEDPFESPKRPKTLIVSIFWATGQAVVDKYTLTALEIEYPDGDIPVQFVFARDSEVPVSFFGPNPTLEQVSKAYTERGIELAEVPVWFLGDHHFSVSLQELEENFDLPDLDEISPERQAAIRAELEAYGFFHKPLTVSVLSENASLTLDQGDVVRVASTMGIDAYPVVMLYFSGSSHLADCGIPLPQISATGGATSDTGGSPGAGPETPAGIVVPPQLPDPERPASGS